MFFTNQLNVGKSAPKTPFTKLASNITRFYTTPVHFDDSVTNTSYLPQSELFQFPLVSDLSENEDTYNSYKNLLEYNNLYASTLLGVGTPSLFPQSYLSALNNFRGDYEDFGW